MKKANIYGQSNNKKALILNEVDPSLKVLSNAVGDYDIKSIINIDDIILEDYAKNGLKIGSLPNNGYVTPAYDSYNNRIAYYNPTNHSVYYFDNNTNGYILLGTLPSSPGYTNGSYPKTFAMIDGEYFLVRSTGSQGLTTDGRIIIKYGRNLQYITSRVISVSTDQRPNEYGQTFKSIGVDRILVKGGNWSGPTRVIEDNIIGGGFQYKDLPGLSAYNSIESIATVNDNKYAYRYDNSAYHRIKCYDVTGTNIWSVLSGPDMGLDRFRPLAIIYNKERQEVAYFIYTGGKLYISILDANTGVSKSIINNIPFNSSHILGYHKDDTGYILTFKSSSQYSSSMKYIFVKFNFDGNLIYNKDISIGYGGEYSIFDKSNKRIIVISNTINGDYRTNAMFSQQEIVGYTPKNVDKNIVILSTNNSDNIKITEDYNESNYSNRKSGNKIKWKSGETLIHPDDMNKLQYYLILK